MSINLTLESDHSVHLNFVPLTLDAEERLDEISTFVYSVFWLAHRDEREFVISSAWKQFVFTNKSEQLCWVLVKNSWCLLRKGQDFAPNTTAKLSWALQIHAAVAWVRAIVFTAGSAFKTAIFALDQAVVTADFVSSPIPVLLFSFSERDKPRRKCSSKDPVLKEKDCGVDKTKIEQNSGVCLDVSRSIDQMFFARRLRIF